MYPLDRYHFYTNGKKVIAVSTYAGKTVRGVATCHENDTFDLEKGKRIAAARCGIRIARKRLQRASHKMMEAEIAVDKARKYREEMYLYGNDAECDLDEALRVYEELMDN